jgi:predicted acylesterase/phospholipase RssA
MAVNSGYAARKALEALLGDQMIPIADILRRPYLPDGAGVEQTSSEIDPGTLIGGYGNKARYVLYPEDPETESLIAQRPAAVLGPRYDDSASVRTYIKSSLDLTMQGGATSGVVYPMAICELATRFKFRNIGGASAGAIAAALTAAAELGRTANADAERLSGHVPLSMAPTDSHPFPIRQGFAGLADLMRWISQTDSENGVKDDFRLAQLFRPTSEAKKLFRIAACLMRGRTWSLPMVLVATMAPIPRLLAAATGIMAVLVSGWLATTVAAESQSWSHVLFAGLWSVGAFSVSILTAIYVCAALLPLLLPRVNLSTVSTTRLFLYSSAFHRPVRLVSLLPILLALVAVGWLFIAAPSRYAIAILVGLAASLLVCLILLFSLLTIFGLYRSTFFGLVGGSSSPSKHRLLDRASGMPKSTINEAVVPWLNNCLSQLAGLHEDEVLRFGHLWDGLDYSERRLSGEPEDRGELRRMTSIPNFRLINLRLMTTDLVRRRPYAFPLQPASEEDQLWLQLDELRESESFPESVLAVLSESESRQLVDKAGRIRTYHALPDPWDVPVIFAVRLSMAMPILFTAIPMYRLVQPQLIRDDLGRTMFQDEHVFKTEIRPPDLDASTKPQTQSDLAGVEELWFSDGGITSNFPVDLFDTFLPQWQSVALSLGSYPTWAPHQDVVLPHDWETDVGAPNAPLTNSGMSFLKATLDTAMTWRDRTQADSNSRHGRIAEVRLRPDEGGTHLFMPRAVVASLALRGALAGARLRCRIADPIQWDRVRWLRLRVALRNLEQLRQSTRAMLPELEQMLSGPEWLENLTHNYPMGNTSLYIPWWNVPSAFFEDSRAFLHRFANAYNPPAEAPNLFIDNVPPGEPYLRQSPT